MARSKNVAVATNGMVALPGQLVFVDLIEPSTVENSVRYGVSMRVSKDSDAFKLLWAEILKQGQKVWGASAKSKLASIQGAIKAGVAPANSPISIQDGDLHNPEHNRGFWWISARRPKGKGRPEIYDVDGQALDLDDPAQQSRAPKPGDGALVLVNVWCQPEYSRMNLTLIAVRKAIEGVPLQGGPSREEVQEATQGLLSLSLPTAIPGVQPAAAQLSAGQATNDLRGAPAPSSGLPELPDMPLEGEIVSNDGSDLDLVDLS